MSKVLPIAIQDRPELNLRQGIKSSLNNWRVLVVSLYLFYRYGGEHFCKETIFAGKAALDLDDSFAGWLDANFTSISNIKSKVRKSPLYLAQMEHLQVGLELFLKLAKINFVDTSLADGKERTGGNRFAKKLRFSTNMKIVADVISSYSDADQNTYIDKWLSGSDDTLISKRVKSVLAPLTEECQYKIRTASGEIFFQQDGIYDRLRDPADTVESADAHEMVGPFRILKSYIKEGMHPYLEDSTNGFKTKLGSGDFISYADMVKTTLELNPKRATIYQEIPATLANPVDRLDVAIRQFAVHRTDNFGSKERSYDQWAEMTRAFFSDVDGAKLVGCDWGEFRKECVCSSLVANSKFTNYTDDEKRKLGDFFKEVRENPRDISYYLENNPDLPGMGPAYVVLVNFLMKARPDIFSSCSEQTFGSLRYLGLITDDTFTKVTPDVYDKYKATNRQIIDKMREMDVCQTADNNIPADYLTANEFTWWLSNEENQNLIEDEIMKTKLETPTDDKNEGNKDWKDVLSNNPDDMTNRLVAALLTKPFAILAGASGTGKSRMVRKLAYMTCLNTQLQPNAAAKKPIENFRMVQVKPNWHDSSDLLGYRSSVSGTHEYVSTDFVRFVLKAHAFPNTPFFVCLDEMNLAPVEHYFAEFLSASESARIEDGEYITDPIIDPGEFYNNIANLDPQGYSIPQARKELIEKRGLYLPKNLFVVGTVNMDDTTGGFSRKVLDRAMTIEMNEVNFDELQKPVELRLMDVTDAQGKVTEKGLLLKATQIEAFINRVDFKPDNFDDPFKTQLEDIRGKLAATTLAFAYRFARECVQYRDALKLLFPNVAGGTQYDHAGFALDHMFLMKILPRLVGNKEDRVAIVKTLETFFAMLTGHGVSAKKLQDMLAAADTNGGFLSYYL